MIIFRTSTVMPLEAMTVFGINEKPNSTNPIGHFGTGLKYAIAVLCRLCGPDSFHFSIDGTDYRFATIKKRFRNRSFEHIYMSDGEDYTVQLPFTTELGKEWELWMAYRELYCNTLDEDGTILTGEEILDLGNPGTAIFVAHPMFDQIHSNKHEYFLQSKPIEVSDDVEVHEGRSQYIFYKGIRAYELSRKSLYTYNIVRGAELTEDRTLKNPSSAEYTIMSHIARESKNGHYIREVVTAKPRGLFEGYLADSTPYSSSEIYDETLLKLREKQETRQLVPDEFFRPVITPKAPLPEESIELNATQSKQLSLAIADLEAVGFPVQEFPIIIVESFEDNQIFGQAKDGKSYVALRSFSVGNKFLAGVIYEEWLHNKKGCFDCTREMQNLIIEDLMNTVERLLGERSEHNG